MYVWTWILQNTYVTFLAPVVQTVDNAIHWIAKDNKHYTDTKDNNMLN